MQQFSRLAACSVLAFGLAAASADAASIVTQTNLVSAGSLPAAFTDPDLVDAWGITASSSGPFWVSDNGTGVATIYEGTGKPQSLVGTVPAPPGSTAGSAPTGQV